MARRRHAAAAAAAFRPSASAAPGRAPSRAQLIGLLAVVAVVVGVVSIAAAVVRPDRARSFDLFYGSVYIDDNYSPVAIDLATGKPSIRLSNATAAVSANNSADVDMYNLGGGNTLMLDRATGEFNMVDSTGFLVKTTDGGVNLPRTTGSTTATAVPAGDSAFILRSGAAAATSVYLVGKPTVSAAVGASRTTKARASATVNRPLADLPAPAASAGNSLWLLTGAAGSDLAVTQLTVPPRSNAGATLTETGHGTVRGPAALGAATGAADGSGGNVAALATSTAVRVFTGSTPVTHPVSVAGTVSQILPATNATGRLVFLYRTAAGWSLVSTGTGSGGGPATVRRLTGLPAADLVLPAHSSGRTYTIDTADNSLWQISDGGKAEPVPGAAKYPFVSAEPHTLSAPRVTADGSRVIFNSRSSYEAEVVFSDGSNAPRVVSKRSAVAVDPTSAAALADLPATNSSPGKTTTPSKPTEHKPQPPKQTINNKIDCKTTQAVPHQPVIDIGDRASRSIVVRWTYPVLDPSDCIPSTYTVSVKVLTPNAPSTPGQVDVQGEDGVTLTGLFPATEYQIAVTAYLNKQHTTSVPVTVSTGPEGPKAPTGVRASADSSGNWTVSWNSCGGIAQGCVPSATWYVLPSFCDGKGLSGLPDKVVVAGDPTAHAFTKVYTGSDATLGRGMCFRVQGVSPQGTAGDTSAPSPIAYSWSRPVASALTLTASQPATTALGASTTTTVDLALGGDPVRTIGGAGASVTFTLTGPDGPQTKTMTVSGDSPRVSATFTGIGAGSQYTAKASVSPPNHPEAAVSTAPVTVTTRSNWPQLSGAASCAPDPGPVVLGCTLTVKIDGLSSAQAGGELFSTVNGEVTCQNAGFPIGLQDFDPASQSITTHVDLLQYNGTCSVSLALVEGARARDPKVFGGTTSPPVATPDVALGQASTLGATPGDFAVDWSPQSGSSVVVRYQGARTDDQVAELTQGWNITLYAPNGSQCGNTGQQPTHGGVLFGVSPASCVNDYGDQQSGWKVGITYYDRGSNNPHSFAYQLNGGPPGYVPCTVSAGNFAAAWAADGSDNVGVTFDGSGGADLRGCSNWSFSVRDTTQQICGQSTAAQYSGTPLTLAISGNCTPLPAWTLVITYSDPAGQTHTLGPILIGGTPPIVSTPTPTPSPTGS